LRSRIRDAAAWHAHVLGMPELRGREWSSGRTAALAPRGLPLHDKSRDEHLAIVESVVVARRELVAGLQERAALASIRPAGRLLLFQPQHTLIDTLSNTGSDGLFDDQDEGGIGGSACTRRGTRTAATKEGSSRGSPRSTSPEPMSASITTRSSA